MSSFTGNQKTPNPSSFSSYQFDFGLGSLTRNSNKPLKDQKANPTAATAPKPSHTPAWAPQPNKPSWTHQPSPAAANLAGPASMVGDIFGKSWSSANPSSSASATSSIGIAKSNPDLFGDLVGSALNQGKGSSNVPLKAAAPAKNLYSMGSLKDSLPKSNNNGSSSVNSMKNSQGSGDNFANFGDFSPLNQSSKPVGGQSMKSMSGAGSNSKQDPFGSLMDFGLKNSGNSPIKSSNAKNPGIDSSFGDFQNAKGADFGIPAQKPAQTNDFNNFGIPSQPQTNQTNQQASDPLDSLFSSTTTGNPSGVSGTPQFAEMNDWDVGAEFGGQDHSETTTELEGLPPPPAGVTSSMAKTKGMDNYKQGQFADAIKWLSWAVVLIEKSGDSADAHEVLICRASCYKEVGEYKKAVADCSKVLEDDSSNVAVLLQRALLYESTEKYKLGAEDLRTVLKIDPANRLAKSTIHRLNKMAG